MAVSTYTYDSLPASEMNALPGTDELAAALGWDEEAQGPHCELLAATKTHRPRGRHHVIAMRGVQQPRHNLRACGFGDSPMVARALSFRGPPGVTCCSLLSVNPHFKRAHCPRYPQQLRSVARAYKELEREGTVTTNGKKGTTIAPQDKRTTPGGTSPDRLAVLSDAAREYAAIAHSLGYDLTAAAAALHSAMTSPFTKAPS